MCGGAEHSAGDGDQSVCTEHFGLVISKEEGRGGKEEVQQWSTLAKMRGLGVEVDD